MGPGVRRDDTVLLDAACDNPRTISGRHIIGAFHPAHSIQIHIANSMRHVLAFSRRIAPELCDRPALRKIERAQGMPGEGLTHGPPATKKQAAVTTGSADHRHSLRDGFNAYT